MTSITTERITKSGHLLRHLALRCGGRRDEQRRGQREAHHELVEAVDVMVLDDGELAGRIAEREHEEEPGRAPEG